MTFQIRNRVIDAIIELVAMKYFTMLKFISFRRARERRDEFKLGKEIK